MNEKIGTTAHCEMTSPLQGAVEFDKLYFGAHRISGKP